MDVIPDPHTELVQWAENILRCDAAPPSHAAEGARILADIRKLNDTPTTPAHAGNVLRGALVWIPPDAPLHAQVKTLIGKLRINRVTYDVDPRAAALHADLTTFAVNAVKTEVGANAAMEHATVTQEPRQDEHGYTYTRYTAAIVTIAP